MTAQFTPERLAAIIERANAATPDATLVRYELGGGRLMVDGESDQRKLVADLYHVEDREFFAEARTDVLDLAAEVRRLGEENARLRGDGEPSTRYPFAVVYSGAFDRGHDVRLFATREAVDRSRQDGALYRWIGDLS